MPTLNISGFTFTGKTAVVHYFKDLENVFCWPGTEGQINRFPGGFYYLWNKYIENKSLSAKDINLAESLLLGELENLELLEWQEYPPETHKWINDGIQKIHTITNNKLLDSIQIFKTKISNLNKNEGLSNPIKSLILLSSFHEFYQTIENTIHKATNSKLTIWDNLFHPFNFAQNALFKNIDVIVVERDARDQYIDAMKDPEFRSKYPTPEAFCEYHRKFRWLFENQGGFSRADAKSIWKEGFLYKRFAGGTLLYISFEAFVQEEAVRNQIFPTMNIDLTPKLRVDAEHSLFKPELSLKNIRKHSINNGLTAEMNIITKMLPEYLY